MQEVLKFLTDNPTFYIATVEGDKPKVRPFGFMMEFEGKLHFCTNNQKHVYKQLQANPYFEVCTASPEGMWIRLRGKAVFNTTLATKARVLEVMPVLANMYSVEDSLCEVFYVDEGEADFCSMTGESKTVKL